MSGTGRTGRLISPYVWVVGGLAVVTWWLASSDKPKQAYAKRQLHEGQHATASLGKSAAEHARLAMQDASAALAPAAATVAGATTATAAAATAALQDARAALAPAAATVAGATQRATAALQGAGTAHSSPTVAGGVPAWTAPPPKQAHGISAGGMPAAAPAPMEGTPAPMEAPHYLLPHHPLSLPLPHIALEGSGLGEKDLPTYPLPPAATVADALDATLRESQRHMEFMAGEREELENASGWGTKSAADVHARLVDAVNDSQRSHQALKYYTGRLKAALETMDKPAGALQ